MDVLELVLIEALEQLDEVGDGLAIADRFAQPVDYSLLMVNLRVAHLVDLLLNEAEPLEVLGVLAMVRDQLADVLMHFLCMVQTAG